ncbi:hypothetical protein AX15_006738 [Amanita polypyramis BW_CC]|nr:hypothetical protein AX15_006738 [Amanita polypyramis BW_CC]
MDQCTSLAHRCVQIFLDLNDIMQDRWDATPPSLLRNLTKYTETLESIHTFMKAQANEKWAKHFIRRASVEAALADFDKKLSDAAQMFQISMLIDINHMVSSGKTEVPSAEKIKLEMPIKEEAESDQLPTYRSRQNTFDEQYAALLSGASTSSASDNAPVSELNDIQDADEVLISETILEDHGFRRYHPSEVKLTGRSKIKGGWWSDTAAADAGGQLSLVKYYEGGSKNRAAMRWLHDVRMLQNIFHPNLPHMIGYSNEHSPTPFILLSDVRTNAPDKILNHTLKRKGVAACLNMLARYHSDITDASTYLQRQLNLSDGQLQDFVEKSDLRVNASRTIIMGLPPAREGTCLSWRNYNLSHSLVQATMNMLPGRGTIQSKLEHYQDVVADEDPLKIAHLISLARGLFSPAGSSSTVPVATKLLENDDDLEYFNDGPKITMKELRRLALEAGIHKFSWTEMSGIPPHKFTVGDFGYVPKDKAFTDFIKFGNIYSDGLANIPISARTYGSQFCWEDRPIQHVEMQNFCSSDGVYCWPISIPFGAQIDCQIEHSERGDVTEAWDFLTKHAKQLAEKFNIAAEDLILVTTAGTNQSFYMRDFGNQVTNNTMHEMRSMHPMLMTQFHRSQSAMSWSHSSISIPTIMYLITSSRPDHQPYWSHQPMHIPHTPRPKVKYGWVPNIGYCHGFIQWIRLLKEDFVD